MSQYSVPRVELLSLDQFENLVKNHIHKFGNFYDEEFRDCWPSTFPSKLSLVDWLELFKLYMTSDEQYTAINTWGRDRADRLAKLRNNETPDDYIGLT